MFPWILVFFYADIILTNDHFLQMHFQDSLAVTFVPCDSLVNGLWVSVAGSFFHLSSPKCLRIQMFQKASLPHGGKRLCHTWVHTLSEHAIILHLLKLFKCPYFLAITINNVYSYLKSLYSWNLVSLKGKPLLCHSSICFMWGH